MKLRKIIKENKVIYTLKESLNGQKTQDAHYKFIKIRDVKEKSLNIKHD